MGINIYRGTSLLAARGLYQDGRVYIPSEALASYCGLWERETVFLNSPLAGKRLCIAVLSSNAGADRFPPRLERFLGLCSAAGAHLTYYDGSGFPTGDVVLAIEPGGSQTQVKYLGTAFGSRPLARKIAANFKQGLKLAYLPDPVSFDKPHYNLKLKLWTQLFTPAVAAQWPEDLDLGPWLFIGLMEYAGGGIMDGAGFSLAPELAAPAPPETLADTAGPELQEHSAAPDLPRSLAPPLSLPRDTRDEPVTILRKPRLSASMSRTQYPDLFANQNRKIIQKEPFC